jgi:hypothetical protein
MQGSARNPATERTLSGMLRVLTVTAHIERWAAGTGSVMQVSEQIFWFIFATIAVAFLVNILRRGGIKAAMFNAEIRGTVGEVETVGAKIMSQRLKIHRLFRDGTPLIGIEVVSKSISSYEMLPLSLTGKQVQQLIALLEEAQKPQ